MHQGNSVSAASSPQHLKHQEEPLINSGAVNHSSCKTNPTTIEINSTETNNKLGN